MQKIIQLRRIISFWLLIYFLICFIFPIKEGIIGDNKLEKDYTFIENTTSLNVNLSGPRFWYVIKTHFSNPTNITQEFNFYINSKNETVNARATFLCEIVYKEGGYDYGLWVPNAYPSREDFYFQFKFGRFNWSYYDINQEGDSVSTKCHGISIYHI